MSKFEEATNRSRLCLAALEELAKRHTAEPRNQSALKLAALAFDYVMIRQPQEFAQYVVRIFGQLSKDEREFLNIGSPEGE